MAGMAGMAVLALTGCALAQQAGAASASAKDSENASEFFATKPAELDVFATGGFGTSQNSSDKFFNVGVHLGKVLTPPAGPGFLRGQFEVAVEVMPFWQAYIPTVYENGAKLGGTFTGFSIVPANFRWDFTKGKRWVPWFQGAGGLIYTTHKFPSPPGDTSVWNFSPQFGIGTHYF